jgi:hypothetical protein
MIKTNAEYVIVIASKRGVDTVLFIMKRFQSVRILDVKSMLNMENIAKGTIRLLHASRKIVNIRPSSTSNTFYVHFIIDKRDTISLSSNWS